MADGPWVIPDCFYVNDGRNVWRGPSAPVFMSRYPDSNSVPGGGAKRRIRVKAGSSKALQKNPLSR